MRDINIEMSKRGLINMNTRSVRDKSKYTRKEKYKSSYKE